MRILFQGDSITDWLRDRAIIDDLGRGYPKYAAQYIQDRFPDIDFQFFNRGWGGRKTHEMIPALQKDVVDIQPDIVSILIGVNDTMHHARTGCDWIPNEEYEASWRTILNTIRAQTQAKILLMEPFLVEGCGPDRTVYYEDMIPKRLILRRLAKEYADVYLPLDGLLAAASVGGQHGPLSDDGVHLNTEGSQVVGKLYAEAAALLITGRK